MYFICPAGVEFILVKIKFLSSFLEHGAEPRALPRHWAWQVGRNIAMILNPELLKSPCSVVQGKSEQKWEKKKNLKIGKTQETNRGNNIWMIIKMMNWSIKRWLKTHWCEGSVAIGNVVGSDPEKLGLMTRESGWLSCIAWNSFPFHARTCVFFQLNF